MVVVQPRPTRRRRVRILAIGIVLLGAVVAVNGPLLVNFVKTEYHNWKINTAAYKRKYGHWVNLTIPADRQINAVHAVMLNTGKVLIMAGSGNDIGNFRAGKFESVVYNPANNSFKKIRTPYDMFCSGHFILPDGNVLIAGGTARYEVLPSQIRYAAGVMTVINSSTTERGLVLPKGTTFESPTGQLYRATAGAAIPAASMVTQGTGRRRKRVLRPSYTPLWVQAQEKGQAPVSQVARSYSILGLPGTATVDLQASAFSITRSEQNFWGTRKSYIFNVRSETYQKVSDLNLARWYPTLVGLKDGNVLAVSGLNQFGQIISGNSEEFNPKTKRWTLEPKLTKSFPTYPALFLMPNGDLFFTGASTGYGPEKKSWTTPGIWNPNTNAFTPVTGMRDPNLTQTAGSIILPPAQAQRYAIIGGGGAGTSPLSTGRIDVVDLDSEHPRWKPDGSLPVGTRYPEVVITPTDGVVISGGSKYYRGMHGSDLMTAHMWMPNTGMLMALASPLVGRDYHSEGLLLPDGRILTLGGNPLFGDKQDTTPQIFHKQISIYSPPYLFHGRRPRLTGGPSSVTRGETVTFTTPDPGQIVKVRLMHPSAVTHVTDVQQRSVAVTFTREHDALTLTIPTNSGLLPSGYYMLFVDSAKGVPSVARWVHVS